MVTGDAVVASMAVVRVACSTLASVLRLNIREKFLDVIFNESKGTPENQNIPPVSRSLCILIYPTGSELLLASPWLLARSSDVTLKEV